VRTDTNRWSAEVEKVTSGLFSGRIDMSKQAWRRLTISWALALAAAPGVAAAQTADPVTARDRDFWAFRPLARPVVPQVKSVGRVRTPIDAFLLVKLEDKGLTFAPDADRATLIRRASFDLWGLPPAPEEVETFLADERPDAYEALLDRLLASPRFGERWGRHWLDAAGYVDVIGGDNDAATVKLGDGKWRYRDYVIRSFNEDKPFDRFLTEQLAGDELFDWRSAPGYRDEDLDLLIATGFLRTAADDTDENELNTPDLRHGVLARTVEVVSGNLLGLTINCARCHDHKYEPIAQRDYYRLAAIFSPAFNTEKWLQPKQRALPDVPPSVKEQIDRHNADLGAQVDAVKKRQAELRAPYEARLFETKSAGIPEAIRADVQAAIRTPADKRTEVQKYLASKFEAMLAVKPEEVTAALREPDKLALEDLERQIAELNGRRRNTGTLQVVYDTGPPSPTYLLRRGNHETPGAEVPPGFLSVLTDGDGSDLRDPPAGAGQTSGRRLALARWLTRPGTPAAGLVARVRVNRVWQQLFGKGIVETSDNLGRTGAAPTHPELLEWLAEKFQNSEVSIQNSEAGRLKPLLKLLMSSTAYRQASAVGGSPSPTDPHLMDPANRLLWRMPLRRLESEIVRDTLLAVGGKLDLTMGGPPVPLEARPDGMVVVKEQGLPTPTSKWRRSVYLLARRNYHPSLLNVFDHPVMSTHCTSRSASAVVSQSLTMLNDAFVLEQGEALADRVLKHGAGAAVAQIEAAFRIALGRKPGPQESLWSVELLRRQAQRLEAAGVAPEPAARRALAHLCHVLLNTSEFLYVP
jgi:hypothetical protein